MKPEVPTNDGGSLVSNKIGSEEVLNESKNKDAELDGFPAELLNKVNNFFEIHSSLLYDDVHADESSLVKYLSADTSEVKMTGNCSNEKEKVEDEKYYSANSQKLYSSLKRYCLRNVKEKSDLSSENGCVSSQSAKNTLINPHTEIEKNITIPDSFQLPFCNETRNTVTFDTPVFENSMIDIKFPLSNSFDLSQDLTEAHRSVRLNKKSTLKKNIKKLMNEKISKTEESFSHRDIVPRDVTEKLENSTLKKHNKKLMNDRMTMTRKIEEFYNPNGIISREVIEESEIEDKKSTLKKNNKKSTNDKMTIPHISEECFNLKRIVSKDVTENPNLDNNKQSTLKKKNRKSVHNKMKTSSETEECFTSKEIFSSDLIEKPELKNMKNIKKSTNKKMLARSKIDECLNSEEIIPSDRIGKPKLENRKTSLRKKNIKKSTNENMIVPYKIAKCFNPEEMVSRDTAETPKLKNKKTSRKINKKPANGKISPYKTEECFSPKNVVSEDTAKKHEIENVMYVNNLKINSQINLCCSLTSDENQIKELSVSLTDCLENSHDFKKQLTNENDILCFEKALTKYRNESDIKTSMEETHESTSKEVLEKSVSKKHSKKNKTSLPDDKSNLNTTNKSENKNFIPDVQNAFMNQSKLSENSTRIMGGNKFKKNKSRISDHLDEKSVISSKRNVSRKKSTSLSHSKTAKEDKNILSENDILEEKNLHVNDFENDLIKDDIVTTGKDLNQKGNSKTAQKILTSTPVSQKSSVKNMLESVNKNASSSSFSGTSQKNSVSFLQLFNKVIESRNSEKNLKSNQSIAKLFEQHNDSKLESTSKICKELDQKQDGEQLLQLNSFKEKSNDLSDLKSFKSAEEKMTTNISLGKKRPNEDNVGILPKKKKWDDQFITNNNEKNFKEISFKNGFEDCDSKITKTTKKQRTKTTKKQSLKGVVPKPTCKSSKVNKKLENECSGVPSKIRESLNAVCTDFPNKKLENEYSGVTSEVPDSLNAVCTNFPIQRRKTLKKTIQNASSSESYLMCQSTNAAEFSSKRSPKRKKSTRAKSMDTLISKKADSLSAEPESTYNEEGFDACDFIKVTDVKSLASGEGDNENWEEKESNVLMPASFSENTKVKKKSRKKPFDSGQKNRKKNKHLQSSEISQLQCPFNNNGDAAEPEENAPLVYNPTDKTRTKRKRRSTSVDPNFYYGTNLRTKREDDKSFSNHRKNTELAVVKKSPRKNMRCEGINSVNEMIKADTVLDKNTNDSTIENCDDVNFNLNSSGISMSSLTSDQIKSLLSPYTLFSVNPQCKILVDSAGNPCMLGIPIQATGNVPALMPNVTVNDMSPAPQMQFQVQNYPVQNFPLSQFISPPQYMNPMLVPEHNLSAVNSPRATSIVSGQTTPSVLVPNSASAVLAPRTIPSVISSNNNSIINFKPKSFV